MLSDEELQILKDFYLDYIVPTEFQLVERHDGMRFIIHSNENCGHNKAHVHMECGDGNLEIELISGKILNASGKISSSQANKASKFVLEHQQLFIDKWNEFSNGIKISA